MPQAASVVSAFPGNLSGQSGSKAKNGSEPSTKTARKKCLKTAHARFGLHQRKKSAQGLGKSAKEKKEGRQQGYEVLGKPLNS